MTTDEALDLYWEHAGDVVAYAQAVEVRTLVPFVEAAANHDAGRGGCVCDLCGVLALFCGRGVE